MDRRRSVLTLCPRSVRATLYALICDAPVAGIAASTSELTAADGSIGHAPVVLDGDGHRIGNVRRAIWAAPDSDDATLARVFALDVARLEAIDAVLANLANSAEWSRTLARFGLEAGSDPSP